MAKKILLVDDEKDIIDLLDYNLRSEGYETRKAYDGNQALEKARSEIPDLIILDIMLPGKDGWEVLRELRKTKETQNIPVIYLTAKDSEIDEVVGLELGAEDYIVKPIAIRKLLARVKKALYKQPANQQAQNTTIKINNLEIDPSRYLVNYNGQDIILTKKEFEILLYLAKRPGRVITRKILLEEIWDDNVIVIDRTIDVHIRKIREKLQDDDNNLIETIKGVGYRFRAE